MPTGDAEYHEFVTRIVQGETLLAKVLHDVSVGIDYPDSLKVVDSSRIGFISHSYGGRMTIWAPAFDQRIKASVSNCGCVNYKDLLNRDIGIQPEFCVPGIMNECDIEDIVRLIAPRALYSSATEEDKYSRGARAQAYYIGCKPMERFRLIVSPRYVSRLYEPYILIARLLTSKLSGMYLNPIIELQLLKYCWIPAQCSTSIG